MTDIPAIIARGDRDDWRQILALRQSQRARRTLAWELVERFISETDGWGRPFRARDVVEYFGLTDFFPPQIITHAIMGRMRGGGIISFSMFGRLKVAVESEKTPSGRIYTFEIARWAGDRGFRRSAKRRD